MFGRAFPTAGAAGLEPTESPSKTTVPKTVAHRTLVAAVDRGNIPKSCAPAPELASRSITAPAPFRDGDPSPRTSEKLAIS